MLSQLRTIKRFTSVLIIAWTLLVAASLGWLYIHQKNNFHEISKAEARIAFQKDTLYRKWATRHGGDESHSP